MIVRGGKLFEGFMVVVECVDDKKARGLWTPREIAAIIGKILWRRSLDLLPLCKVAPIIAILRRVSL